MSNVEALLGRAKRKTITQKSALSLIDVARRKKKGKAKIKSYWNTYHCQSRLVTSEGRSHAKYCKNRFCTICLSIRKATIINKYLPFVVTWEDPHFVALTVKAIPARLLPKYCKGFLKLFGEIDVMNIASETSAAKVLPSWAYVHSNAISIRSSGPITRTFMYW